MTKKYTFLSMDAAEIYPKVWALMNLWFTTHIKTTIFARTADEL
ncbi:hypothetical protein [Butyrivibrio sp.]|nr:hypothetical protein [Butyrivibrio sp.]